MSFILDALRKLEEKRAPETTRELLSPGIPAPRAKLSPRPLWPWILTAALAVSLLSAAGWFALGQRDVVREDPAPPALSSGRSGEEGPASMPEIAPPSPDPPRPSGPGRAPETAVTAPPLPVEDGEPQPDAPAAGVAPVPDAESEVPPPSAVADIPDRPAPAETTAEDVPPLPAESPAPPLVPFEELPEEIRDSLKGLKIEGHVYSEDSAFRLLSIDGSLKREGDGVRPGLLIESISPEGAVFSYRGFRFSMKGY